ncbi:winged helix-turn-helix domain-containing protein [Nocardiopsis ganjiahuensis]|uniref:winged helix-turn-helix domain-containing protein n=1 Tax=Nocardiopsis ganjiahuensis TaxID=239984 RepID=UPI00034AC1E9|nr:winged helix-turn-helix domain-containing protein [Nocardiopsis ganjiahuensis]
MKLMWKKTANPAHSEPPLEAAAPPAPAPAPEPVVADDQTPEPTPPAAAAAGEPGGIDFTRVIASVVTAASAVFTVWSVWDLARHGAEEGQAAPHAVGLGAGIGVEAVWLWLLAIEWQQASRTGRVNPVLTRTGWVLAAGASVVLVVHGVMTSWPMALLAVLPLAAKAGWHWLTALRCEQTRTRLEAEGAAAREAALAQRRAEEEARREQAAKEALESKLSSDLTETQRAELAELEREAAYVSAKTEKELALDAARAHAEQQRVLAQIRRQAEQQMTVDEASADIEVRRAELRTRIHLATPLYTAQELPAADHHEQVPDDPSGFGVAPVAGFGAGLSQARAQGGGIGRQGGGIAPDLQGRPSPTVGGGGIGRQGGGTGADQAERAPHHAARLEVGRDTRQRVLEEIRYAGVGVSNAELSRLLGIGRTTVRDHRNALREAGHRVYPDSE